MKMSKNYKKLCFILGICVICSASMMNAANYTKTLKATYNNIQVNYNGVTKSLPIEPFSVDGTTYVPLRGVSDIMGAKVEWNGTTKTVIITDNKSGSSYDTTALQQQLATANYNVATLTRELEAAKAELATYKSSGTNNPGTTTGTDITLDQLAATETYLKDNYATYFSKINLDFDLKKSSNKFVLTISYSTSKQNTEFEGLSDSKVKSFLNTVCGSLVERHKGMAVEGTVEYTRSSEQKYDFTYSKTGVLDYERVVKLDESDVKDSIDDFIDDEASFRSDSLGKLTENGISVSINKNKEEITYKIYINAPSDTSKITAWNNKVSRDDDDDLEDFMIELEEYIQETYNTKYTVVGYIYDKASDTRIARYDASGFNMYSFN